MHDAESLVDTERAILGAACRDAEIREALVATASPEWFIALDHRRIFTAFQTLVGKGDPIDAAALLRAARAGRASVADQVVDPAWVISAFELGFSTTYEAVTESHLPALREGYLLRSLEALASALQEHVGSASSAESVQVWLRGKLDALGEQTQVLAKSDADVLRAIRIRPDGQEYIGARTHVAELDRVGFRLAPGRIITIAARPSMGKTALSMQFALGASADGVGVAYFMLEMGESGWQERRVNQLTGEPFGRVVSKRGSERSYRVLAGYCKQADDRPLWVIDSTPAVGANEILGTLRLLKRENPELGVCVIDQMRDLAGWDDSRKGEGRDQQPTRIIRQLKRGCQTLGLTLIMVQQLNRKMDDRSKQQREPVLSDLRDTGTFEEVSDLVVFVHRPNFDDGAEDDARAEDAPKDDVALLKIAKWRNGVTRRMMVAWDGPKTKFGTWHDPLAAEVEREIDGAGVQDWLHQQGIA